MNRTIFSLIIFVVLGVLACGETGKKKGSVPEVISGSRIYIKNCTQCHGAKGNLGLNGAANFKDSKLTLEERIHVITNGRKTMLPYKKVLSKKKIEAVAAYTMKLQTGGK